MRGSKGSCLLAPLVMVHSTLLVASPGSGLMLASWHFSSQQPLPCVLLDPASGTQCPRASHPFEIPFQAQLLPVCALHRTAPLQGAGLPHCERWVLLCWAGFPILLFHQRPSCHLHPCTPSPFSSPPGDCHESG